MVRPILIATTLLVPTTLVGQQAAQYSAPDAPVTWVSDNPFLLYLIRSGDTVGAPVRGISVVHDRWAVDDDALVIHRRSSDVGFGGRAPRRDSLRVALDGTTLLYNGSGDRTEGEWDGFLRLPETRLEVGTRWENTLSHETTGPSGPGLYSARREYTATRMLDSAGVSGIEVLATGQLDFRMSMWTDSTAGSYRWFDLTGPLDERYVFDPARGQLVLTEWTMQLTGLGGDFDGTVSDTTDAGLRSAITRYRIDAERAAFLMDPLPGSDSTVTFQQDGRLLFLHTVGRGVSELNAGFSRADGLVGRANVEIGASGPTRWLFEWYDLKEVSRTFDLVLAGQELSVNGTSLSPPTESWGVTEYAMSAPLLPSLEAIESADAPVPFSVYRPTAETWDQMTVSVRDFLDFVLYVLADENGGQTVLIVSADGTLLYDETITDATSWVRTPLREGARLEELQAAIERVRAGI